MLFDCLHRLHFDRSKDGMYGATESLKIKFHEMLFLRLPDLALPNASDQLLEGGARVEAKSDRSFTPLLLAAKGGHLEVVRELRGAGKANIEATNDRSFTPLHLACQNDHQEVSLKASDGRKASLFCFVPYNVFETWVMVAFFDRTLISE